MNVGPAHYLVLGGIVFAIGLFGVAARRSVPAALGSLSVLFAGPLIGAAGVAETGTTFVPRTGDALGLVIVGALCAQLIIGAAIAALVWRRADTFDIDELGELDG